MVGLIHKACTHYGCTTIPCFGVNGTKVCVRHAEEGMMHLIIPNNPSGVRGRSGGSARGCRDVAVDGGTARRASAAGSRTGRSLSSTTTDSKRARQGGFHTTLTSTSIEIAVNEHHAPGKDGSLSEPDEPEDTVVETEVAASCQANPTGAVPGQAVVAENITPAEDCSHAEADGVVKTETGISFPKELQLGVS